MAINMGNQDDTGINEINITPFVDIVLVLLIIFMISTPAMVYRGMRVNLPKAMNSEDLSHVTLTLMLSADGKLWIDKREITLQDLKGICDKLKENKTEGDALISADSAVTHGKVMEVADFLKTQGIQQIGFATSSAGADTRKK